MSYILDALKKSEKERQQENGPGLHSVHSSVPGFQDKYSKKKTTPARWSFAAISCSLALALSYYFYQRTFPVDIPHEVPPPAQQAEVNPPPAQVASKTEPALVVLTRDERKIVHVHNTGSPHTPAGTSGNTGIHSQTLPSVQQLPEELKRNIPEMTLVGHTYSDTPEQRMVIINNKILREGSTLDGTLRLVEITWGGVVLDYKGTRFQQNIK